MVMLNDGGKWLKTADTQNGEKIVFIDEGSWQESQKFTYKDGNKKMDFVIGITHNLENKQMRLNGGNRAVLTEAYGKDTSKWVGKSATIQKMTALVAGKKMDVIVLEANTDDQGESIEQVDIPF